MKFEVIAGSQNQPLNGFSIFRSNGEVICINGISEDPTKLPLTGATIKLTIRDYSTGISNELVVKSTPESGVVADNLITIDSQSPDSIVASCKLIPTDTSSLPLASPVELYFKLDVISTGLNYPITAVEGKFLSKPDSV